MRAAIYLRVSTDAQEVLNQELQLKAYCERSSWQITKFYRDKVTGGVGEDGRPGLKALLEDASRHKFDVLVFWALDRLSREGTLKTILYLQQLDHYHVAYRSYMEPYLDSTGPFKEVIISLLACLAKQEKLRISERTRAGMARAKAQGKIIHRPRTIGDSLTQRIRHLRSEGLSYAQIAVEVGVSKSAVAGVVKLFNAKTEPLIMIS